MHSKSMIAAAVRNALAAGAAAWAIAFLQMDANPALFLHDKFFVSDRRINDTFQGKTMWITGASSGIGAELALKFSEHGIDLILSARASDRLTAVAEECQRRIVQRGKGSVTTVPADFVAAASTLEETVGKVLQCTRKSYLDFVILNAGVGQLGPASISSHEDTDRLFQVNTISPIAVTQILLKLGALRKDRGKHLVVTSSVAAKFGVPLSASYAASKHALHGYYNSLTAELPWLRVDLICPGSTDTDFHSCHERKARNKIEEDTSNTVSKKKQLKMPANRCSELIVSSMTCKRGGEFWIAEHPVLLGLYVHQYCPALFQKALKRVGPMRVEAWQQGLDLYDPATWKQLRSKRRPQDKEAED